MGTGVQGEGGRGGKRERAHHRFRLRCERLEAIVLFIVRLGGPELEYNHQVDWILPCALGYVQHNVERTDVMILIVGGRRGGMAPSWGIRGGTYGAAVRSLRGLFLNSDLIIEGSLQVQGFVPASYSRRGRDVVRRWEDSSRPEPLTARTARLSFVLHRTRERVACCLQHDLSRAPSLRMRNCVPWTGNPPSQPLPRWFADGVFY